MASALALPGLVAALPEIYQPIFGHPELSTAVSRSCDHRFATIGAVYDVLAAALGRPARVLDLGCAQGWFSLSLAQRGALVRGVDFNPANVAACQELAGEHPEWNVWFERADIAAVIDQLRDDEFDMALGLSVFHHLCERNGKDSVRALLGRLLRRVPNCLLELALAGEPPAWARALPDDPEYLLEPMPFYRVLSRHPTHLSNLDRPLYFCSRDFWLLDELQPFRAWSAHEDCRLYRGAHAAAKVWRATPATLATVEAEARFASHHPEYATARRLAAGGAEGRVWQTWEPLPAGNLAELIEVGVPYNPSVIVAEVLRQLAAWETCDLFHLELRAAHVIAHDDGRIAIAESPALVASRTRRAWPQQPFVQFWMFAYETLNRKVLGAQAAKPEFLRPEQLPETHAGWARAFWNTPAAEWSFAKLLETLPT